MMKKTIFLFSFMLLLSGCEANNPSTEGDSMSNMPCHKMGESYMGDCKFDENGNPVQTIVPTTENEEENEKNIFFSTETKNLPEAKARETVELSNGETYTLTASVVKQEIGNKTIKRLAYNGQIPGPLLKVKKDAEITLKFINALDVESTVHSHGVRVDNAFDGVPGVSQKVIEPGESFEYKIKFPDSGIYWYHPHVREDYTQELGLYGNYLVAPEDEAYWNPVNREEVLDIDDMLVDSTQPRFSKNSSDHGLMGRFGNIMLINNEEDYSLKVKKNEVVRLYITNVANTRTFNLSIPGVKMKVVGGDLGRSEREEFKDSVIMGPAERYIIEVLFPKEGDYDIQNKTPEKTFTLGTIEVKGEVGKKDDLSGNFKVLRTENKDYKTFRDQIQTWLKKKADKNLKLSIEMKGMKMPMNMNHDGAGDGIEWEDNMAQMNEMSDAKNVRWKLVDEDSDEENMNIDWKFKKDDLVKIKIFNDPNSVHPMQHPIHFHGQRFLVLSRNGQVNENLQWKDTALIRSGETVEILVDMSNPGKWMAHCHIAEHLETGMMMEFEVSE